MVRDDFGILILTHGRAESIVTVEMLEKVRYTGKWYCLIDNEDDQAEAYKKRFGEDRVIVFDKRAVAEWTDAGDNIDKRTAILWARNVSFYVAEQLGLKYFMMLDDDYANVYLKYCDSTREHLYGRMFKMFDDACEMCCDFLDATPTLSIAFAQGGDWIGGINNRYIRHLLFRKCMNSFVCRTDRKFKYTGRMNEDVTTYVRNAMLGRLMFTCMPIVVIQLATQSLSGGMTEEYVDGGTYLKSFYSVMYAPSAVKVSTMPGPTHIRIHHHIEWNNCETKIISEKYKKK